MKAKTATRLVNLKLGEESLENQKRNQVCSGAGNQGGEIESVGKKELSSGPEKTDSGQTLWWKRGWQKGSE